MPYTTPSSGHPSPQASREKLARRTVNAALLGSLLTAGCGGGGGNAPPFNVPVVTSQPSDATVIEGASISFSVTLADDASASYQWLRNGADIPGENSRSITLSNVARTESGNRFSVKITNPAGTIESRAALLSVTPSYGISQANWQIEDTFAGLDSDTGTIFFISNQTGMPTLRRNRLDGTPVEIAKGLLEYPLTFPLYSFPRVISFKATNGDFYFSQSNTYFSINSERSGGGKVFKISPEGAIRNLFDSPTISPAGVALGQDGGVYTVDLATNELYKLGALGTATKIAELGTVYAGSWIPSRAVWLSMTPNGTLYAGLNDATFNHAVAVAPGGQVTNIKAGRKVLGLGSHGHNVYLLEEESPGGNQVIRKISSDGVQSIVAGTLGATGGTTLGPLPGRLSGLSWLTQSFDGAIFALGNTQTLRISVP